MSYPTARNREYMNDRYAKQRNYILTRLGGACVKCGSVEDLEVDHIDWRSKSIEVGRLWAVKRWHVLEAELTKCQILCHWCHTEKSKRDLAEQAEIRGFTHGTEFGWMKTKCRCDLCSASKRAFYDKRNAERRAETIARGSSRGARGAYGRPSSHGEVLHYRRGCRCDLCRAANAQAARDLKSRKQV